MGDTVAVKLDYFPWTSPHTLAAIRTSIFDDSDLRFHQFDGILRTDSYAASAEIAFARDDVNHER